MNDLQELPDVFMKIEDSRTKVLISLSTACTSKPTQTAIWRVVCLVLANGRRSFGNDDEDYVGRGFEGETGCAV